MPPEQPGRLVCYQGLRHQAVLPVKWHFIDDFKDMLTGSWYLGGLNFQVEHHLFPKVCHLHYPALSRIVEQTCREHGIRYRANKSVTAALKSHVRWLKHMGRPAMESAV